MRKDSKADFVSLDVTGVKELKLVSDEAGNGGLGDFASWADTKVYSINSRPKLTIPASQIIKVGETLNLTEGVYAIDAEDGDITSNVVLSGDVNFNKVGRYNVTYTITDNDGNTVEKARTISVVNMEDYTYLSDIKWKSANSGWRTIQKDKSIEENPIRLTDENGNEVIRYSNADGNKLPKFETVIKREWNKVKEKLQHNTEDLTKNFWAE